MVVTSPDRQSVEQVLHLRQQAGSAVVAAEYDVETKCATAGVEEPLPAGLARQHALQLRRVEVVGSRSGNAAVGEQGGARGRFVELQEHDEHVVPAHDVDGPAAVVATDSR